MYIDKLGESEIIKLIRQTVKKRNKVMLGIGDDACVLGDGKTVITTDSYAQGVHFDLSYMSFYDVGTRTACACLSDVVAMGAQPVALLVALALPRQTDAAAVRQLYKGIDYVCRKLDCEIAGGDLIAFDKPALTLTALGVTPKPLLRATARPADFVCITGHSGLAETGRLLLARRVIESKTQKAISRHLCPMPRIKIMKKLRNQINALIDTSDGIATDARHIAEMSLVRIVINPELLPIHPLSRILTQKIGVDTIQFCLTAGEDYELLFTTPMPPPSRINNIPVTVIGRVEKGFGVYLEGEKRKIPLIFGGYDHFNRLR
ncbi:MAG: thiamine-phosphate kinase [bacterium]